MHIKSPADVDSRLIQASSSRAVLVDHSYQMIRTLYADIAVDFSARRFVAHGKGTWTRTATFRRKGIPPSRWS